MIAKIIVHEKDRLNAAIALAAALDETEVWPVKTNAAFLAEAAAHPEFVGGDVDTGFIPRHLDALLPEPEPSDFIWNFAAIAMRTVEFGNSPIAADHDPWSALDGFRFNAAPDLRVALRHGGETRVIDLAAPHDIAAAASVVHGDNLLVFYQGQAFAFMLPGTGGAGAGGGAEDGTLVSPMPGRIIAVDVRQGDRVAQGQKLVTLEAMKMEHSLTAPFDGVVAELHAAEGGQVTEGALLVRLEKEDAA